MNDWKKSVYDFFIYTKKISSDNLIVFIYSCNKLIQNRWVIKLKCVRNRTVRMLEDWRRRTIESYSSYCSKGAVVRLGTMRESEFSRVFLLKWMCSAWRSADVEADVKTAEDNQINRCLLCGKKIKLTHSRVHCDSDQTLITVLQHQILTLDRVCSHTIVVILSPQRFWRCDKMFRYLNDETNVVLQYQQFNYTYYEH